MNFKKYSSADDDPEALKRPHKCDDCGKRFARIADLTRHNRKHGNEIFFKCTDLFV